MSDGLTVLGQTDQATEFDKRQAHLDAGNDHLHPQYCDGVVDDMIVDGDRFDQAERLISRQLSFGELESFEKSAKPYSADFEERYLRCLLAEGLALIAAYRRISDPWKRREVLALIEQTAAIEGAEPHVSPFGVGNLLHKLKH